MLLGQMLLQQDITDGAWERNVYGSPKMNMTNFGLIETKLLGFKLVGMDGNMLPC